MPLTRVGLEAHMDDLHGTAKEKSAWWMKNQLEEKRKPDGTAPVRNPKGTKQALLKLDARDIPTREGD